MTFKHVKFEDSPTMRALEKVAKEKGLVKPESLQKRASIPKKADYTPSSDFMENIFKLCAGLRTQGLESEASELEVNYLNYKRAQTLYETSKETGEDLVQSAHPKGSHKLEGVDSDEATVEDILEQHMKMIQVVEKKPHGKLSTANDVISEVKKALGQTPASAPKVEYRDATPEEIAKATSDQISKFVKSNIVNLAWQAHGIASQGLGPAVTKLRNNEINEDIVHQMGTRLQESNNAWRTMSPNNPSVEGLAKMLEAIKDTKGYALTQLWNDKTLQESIASAMEEAGGKIAGLISNMKEFNRDSSKIPSNFPIKPQAVKEAPSFNINSKIDTISGTIKYYMGLVDRRIAEKYRNQAKKYLTDWQADLGLYRVRVEELQKNPAGWESQKASFDKKVSEIDGWVTDFGKQWLKE